MQAKLDNYVRTLNTLILIRLDTHSLRRLHDLGTLDQSVRDLALRIERGRKTTDRLLASQTSQIRDLLIEDSMAEKAKEGLIKLGNASNPVYSFRTSKLVKMKSWRPQRDLQVGIQSSYN